MNYQLHLRVRRVEEKPVGCVASNSLMDRLNAIVFQPPTRDLSFRLCFFMKSLQRLKAIAKLLILANQIVIFSSSFAMPCPMDMKSKCHLQRRQETAGKLFAVCRCKLRVYPSTRCFRYVKLDYHPVKSLDKAYDVL
ncbi:hypothetical protein AC1031_022049 [Aphanomyces cochlioides]|nr:hypothetical protein AC1031_022152 [Aphanomyces cochlioides]KAG9398414.1 hypothetical protein AC1031_022049 [Aphanomyces cochlioides]